MVVVRHTNGGGQVDLEVTEEQEGVGSGRCGYSSAVVDVNWRVKGPSEHHPQDHQPARSRKSLVKSTGASSAFGELSACDQQKGVGKLLRFTAMYVLVATLRIYTEVEREDSTPMIHAV